MSEKRFEYIEFDGFIDNENEDDEYINPHEVAMLLNSLCDENERLQHFESLYREQHLQLIKGNTELKKENEQLKHQVNCLQDRLDDYVLAKKENMELKSLLAEVEHELTIITGLSAFDKCGCHLGYVEVSDKDRIELDYSKLLYKIGKVIK